jgi:hypothetical protein
LAIDAVLDSYRETSISFIKDSLYGANED